MLGTLSARDLAFTTIAAITLAVLLRVFVVGVFSIPSHSMEHTLQVGDHILVSKLAHAIGDLERGDVIVFTLPDSLRGDLPDEPFIKRVIGLPGDTVYLSRLGITINGDLLPDPPTCRHRSPLPEGHKTIVVPKDAYYVIGDNRDNSFDSRYWGPLPADHVMGTAIMIYWSRGDHGVRWDRMFSFVL